MHVPMSGLSSQQPRPARESFPPIETATSRRLVVVSRARASARLIGMIDHDLIGSSSLPDDNQDCLYHDAAVYNQRFWSS
jgi:hypothetical protein